MHLGHLCLSHFGPCVNQSADETDDDCGDGAEGNWGGEEDKTKDGNGELVDGSDHGVGCGGSDSDAPG